MTNHWVITSTESNDPKWFPTYALRMFVGNGKNGWWHFDTPHQPRNFQRVESGDMVFLYNSGSREPYHAFMASAQVGEVCMDGNDWPYTRMSKWFEGRPGRFGLLLEKPVAFFEPIYLNEDLRVDPAGKALGFKGFFKGPHGGLENLGSGPGTWEDYPGRSSRRSEFIRRWNSARWNDAKKPAQLGSKGLREKDIENEIRRQILRRETAALNDFCEGEDVLFAVSQVLAYPAERRGAGTKRHKMDLEIGLANKEVIVEVKDNAITEEDVSQLKRYVDGFHRNFPNIPVKGIVAGLGRRVQTKTQELRYVSAQPYADRLLGLRPSSK